MGNSVFEIVIIFLIILGSMILHELAHGLTALKLGDSTAQDAGRLTLNPIKHLDPIMSFAMPLLLYITGGPIFGGAKPVPVNTRNLKYGEWGMALVALAGPMTNFLLALVGFLIGFWTGGWMNTGVVGLIFQEFVVINLGFGIFNLIPIPPLDGSRVLYALAPDGVRTIMMGMERYGIIIVLILITIFGSVFSGLMVGAINGILRFFYMLVGVN